MFTTYEGRPKNKRIKSYHYQYLGYMWQTLCTEGKSKFIFGWEGGDKRPQPNEVPSYCKPMALFTNLKINLTFFFTTLWQSPILHMLITVLNFCCNILPVLVWFLYRRTKVCLPAINNDIEFKNKIAAMNDYHSSWDWNIFNICQFAPMKTKSTIIWNNVWKREKIKPLSLFNAN